MVSRRRVLLGAAAAALTGAGVSSTGAFSDVNAGREVRVGTAPDADALVGMEGLADPSSDNVFTNNATSTMDLVLDATPYQSGIEWDVNDTVNDDDNDAGSTSFTLTPGSSATVSVKGADTVTFDGDVTLRDGSTVGRVAFTRTIDVPLVNNLALSGSVSASGSSGKFAFTLANTGSVDATILELGVVETTTDADKVTGGGSLFDANTGTEYVTDRLPIDNSTSGATRRALSPAPTLDHQNDGDGTPQERTFEFDKFRRSGTGKPNVDMRGQDVRISVQVRNESDGTVTTATVNLCSGGCDF